MADGKGQRVGRVVRARHRLEPQQVARHVHHLTLFGQTVPHDGLLDLHGRVFIEFLRVARGGHQRRAARLTHGDARRYILGEEQFFESDLIGLVNREKLLHARVNRKQSRRHRRLCLGRQRAILHQAMAGAIRFNHAIAHNRQPRIDAQDNHAIPLPYPMPSMIREKFSLVKKI